MLAMVIDDSRAMRAILRRIVTELGFECVEAADGQEALDKMSSGPLPDIALVDWNMPVVDGLQYVTAVRKNKDWRDVTLMMVTTEGEHAQIVRALAAVDEAILDPSLDKRAAWRIRRFDVLYKGDDWRGTEKGRRMEQQLAEVGARIEYFPYTAHTSSTVLRQHLEGA